MKLFISRSKEIVYYITQKRYGIFFSWKFIFLCKFYRNKVVRSTEHSWPTHEVSANWGSTCRYQSVMTVCSQENLNYRSHAADVESLDNLITIVCRGRNAAIGWQLFLSSKTILNLVFVAVKEESSLSHPHTMMSQNNWGFRKLFYKIAVLVLQALAQDRHPLFETGSEVFLPGDMAEAKVKVKTPLKFSMYGATVQRGPALVRRALAELRIRPGTWGSTKLLSAVNPTALLQFKTIWYRLAIPTTREDNQGNAVDLDPLKNMSCVTQIL